ALDACVAARSPPSVFFFSSRRRHTRFSRDWSSDVCSSDLDRGGDCREPASPWIGACGFDTAGEVMAWLFGDAGTAPANEATGERSEERRVGKEWRSRRSAAHRKNKPQLSAQLRDTATGDRP